MAEKDDEEKTEEPSTKKREDAFKEGTFPHAPEVQMAFMMLAAFFALLFYATSAAQQVGHMTMGLFYGIKDVRIDHESAAWWMEFLFKQGIIIVSPVVIPCTLASIMGGGLQTGFKMTTKVFAWKPERLNPVEGLKNLFSKNKIQIFFIELLKFITVLVIVFNGVRILLDDPIFHHPVSAHYTLQFLHRLFLSCLCAL
jgi:flagellar biosynthesis protein FlhB